MTGAFVFKAVRRRLLLICMVIALGLACASAYGRFAPTSWTASGQVLIGTNLHGVDSAATGNQYLLDRMATYAALAQTEPVLGPAGQPFGLSSAELLKRTAVSVVPSTVVIQISASGASPNQAVALTQAVMDSYAKVAPALDQRSGAPTLLVEQVERPSAPTAPDQLHGGVLLLLGGLAGLLIGIGLALLLELGRLRRARESEQGAALEGAAAGSSGESDDDEDDDEDDDDAGYGVRQPYRLRVSGQKVSGQKKVREVAP